MFWHIVQVVGEKSVTLSNLDWYSVAILVLLPLMAGVLIGQKNPYYALVIRGILGAIAALVYAMLGAADVALTEALVGTMLSITLYAVAVRSSMSMRLGLLEAGTNTVNVTQKLNPVLKKILEKYQVRLEPVVYPNAKTLQQALLSKDVHTILDITDPEETFVLRTRVPRLYEILKTDSLTELVELQLLQPIPSSEEPVRPQPKLMENQS